MLPSYLAWARTAHRTQPRLAAGLGFALWTIPGAVSTLLLVSSDWELLERCVVVCVPGYGYLGLLLLLIASGSFEGPIGFASRRRHLLAASWLVWAGGLIAVMITLLAAQQSDALDVSLLFWQSNLIVTVAVGGWSLAKRSRNDRRAARIVADGGFVLLLRPFSADSRAAAGVALNQAGLADPERNARVLGEWYFLFESQTGKSLDRHLSRGFEREVGPAVAIGDPRDWLPPAGVPRIYVADSKWQETVLGLLSRATCVVIIGGDSPGLAWELAQVRTTLDPQRVVFLTEGMTGSSEYWESCRRVFEQAGFRLPALDPGANAVLVFDAEGRAHQLGVSTLAARAATGAIAEYLRSPSSPANRPAVSTEHTIPERGQWLRGLLRSPFSGGITGTALASGLIAMATGAAVFVASLVNVTGGNAASDQLQARFVAIPMIALSIAAGWLISFPLHFVFRVEKRLIGPLTRHRVAARVFQAVHIVWGIAALGSGTLVGFTTGSALASAFNEPVQEVKTVEREMTVFAPPGQRFSVRLPCAEPEELPVKAPAPGDSAHAWSCMIPGTMFSVVAITLAEPPPVSDWLDTLEARLPGQGLFVLARQDVGGCQAVIGETMSAGILTHTQAVVKQDTAIVLTVIGPAADARRNGEGFFSSVLINERSSE